MRDTLTKILAGEKDLSALLPETYAAARAAERAPDGRRGVDPRPPEG
ncbi:MAG: hypothetical protein ABSF69_29385 [Polyangiaceae bacterium]